MPTLHDFAFDDDQLRRDIATARRLFVERVLYRIPALYHPRIADARAEVEYAFKLTNDLRDLHDDVVAANPHIVAALRYTAGPPISEEDFRTVTGWPFSPSPRARSVQASAPAVCDAIRQLLDPTRFPWVAQDRPATPAELEAGLNATATLLAVERFRTARRGSASKEQEQAVRNVLEREAGLRHVEVPPRRGRGNINMIDDLGRGTFTTECVLYGDKCDVPVRLPDGVLMPIECKVSNGQKNGWKRVRREVEGKAGRWRQRFGDAGIVVGVMLDGNFDLGVLKDFQEQGCFIFWQHDLQRLVDFVNAHDL